MPKRKDESYEEFEFDKDFSINSVHLDEFHRRKQQSPSAMPDPSPVRPGSQSGGKFNRHRNPYGNEPDFHSYENELEDDFSDVSGFSPREPYNETDAGNAPSIPDKKPSRLWIWVVLLIVGIGAAMMIKQIISKNSVGSVSENNGAGTVSASEINRSVSPSDGTTVTTTSTKPTETEPSAPVYKTLRLGDQGDEVMKMQLRLKKLGYVRQTSCTGYYGEYTQKIIKMFQRKAGLKATGTADQKTLEVLYSDDAPACY